MRQAIGNSTRMMRSRDWWGGWGKTGAALAAKSRKGRTVTCVGRTRFALLDQLVGAGEQRLGTISPSALPVLRLITNSYLLRASTGKVRRPFRP
jgi:hypothetical protein